MGITPRTISTSVTRRLLAAGSACIAALLLNGCSDPGVIVLGAPHAATTVYVLQATPGAPQVLEFSAAATGTATPTATLSLPTTANPTAIATDASGNIYVAQNTAPVSILVYAAGAIGAATPVRTITACTVCAPNFSNILSMAVDASGNLYTGNGTGSAISVYPVTATGAATPTKTITGLTLVPRGIAVDASGNVYVAGGTQIEVFAPSATGPATPTRVIGGAGTGLTNIAGAIGVDASSNVYVANTALTTPLASTIAVFGATQTGNVAPASTITGLTNAPAVVVDGTGKIVVASGPVASSYVASRFAAGASGTATATNAFTSTNWTTLPNGSIAVY